nr:uncharacterized protein LOC119167396 isoform X2 [Rhipicephalus microplus]
MHLQMFLVLYFSLTVHTEQVSEIEYDTYEEEETTTRKALPPSRRTRKPQRNQVYSIEKFLNTCDPIWVYNSTEKANITCRVDVMEDVNFFYANITRYTLSNGEVNAVSAKAQFSYHPNLATTSDDYNEMKLEIPGHYNPFETLIYMSDDSSCGVFYVNYHSEMHLPAAQTIIPEQTLRHQMLNIKWHK